MESTQVVRWGERVYGPFAEYSEALAFIEKYGRDAREKRMAHVCTLESPDVLAPVQDEHTNLPARCEYEGTGPTSAGRQCIHEAGHKGWHNTGDAS